MRNCPDRIEAARARLSAMASGSFTQDHATRRTAGRRVPPSEQLAGLSDIHARIAANPTLFTKVTQLASAIELAVDIAAVIDRPGRALLDEALPQDIRESALSARNLSGPRRFLSGEKLINTLIEERAIAETLWFAALPADTPHPNGCEPAPLPAIGDKRRSRMAAILNHAENTVLGITREEELAA